MSTDFDTLLQRVLDEYVEAVNDHKDRERERCNTGRPHGPVGDALDIVLYGCRCQRFRVPKDFIGLRGFLDGPALKAEVMWYGPYTPGRRVARLTDITEA